MEKVSERAAGEQSSGKPEREIQGDTQPADTRILASRTVRKETSVALSYSVFYLLLCQLQQTNISSQSTPATYQ